MQRQSLGSPYSKLHIHGGAKENNTATDDHQKRKEPPSSPQIDEQEEDRKSQKKPHKSPSDTYIHLIPILTFFCFLILYLSSHDPSLSDLAQFNGFKRLTMPMIDSREIDEFGKILEVQNGDVLAIRRMRNLQEINNKLALLKQRFHRKIGDF